MSKNWSLVAERLADAKAIAWDTCHKIYVLMDYNQAEQMREFGYNPVILTKGYRATTLNSIVKDWYKASCGLRFVECVSTNENGDPVFESLIGQFE